jgi:argininosuccinate lyase
MRDFQGMEHMFDEAYSRRLDHRFHSMGCFLDDEWIAMTHAIQAQYEVMDAKQPWWTMTDRVWVVCLYKAGVLEREKAAKVLRALAAVEMDSGGDSGEERLAPLLEEGMDLASVVNYGRTLQEPMSRLKMRDKMLEVMDDVLHLLETFQTTARDHLETVMTGYTHLNHGQPMTFAHYLNGMHDGIYRGLQQLEMAYGFTNRNTGGCGSCSGITWPVDRALQAKLLGMDGVVEPAYEGEAAQDHTMAILFGLTNICTLLSQNAMFMNIWAMDEIDMVRTPPSWCGCSSFMPQKCDSGSNYERTRMLAADVMGETVKCLFQLRGEPYADMQGMFQLPDRAMHGILAARHCMQFFDKMLGHAIINKDRMLAIARAGYICATEVATHLVQELGYGGRLAHSIVATMIRQARVKGLKSFECTGTMLDEAAEYLGVRKPELDDATLRRLLDPVEFVNSHTNTGGTAPAENKRLLDERAKWLDEARQRHAARRNRVAEAAAELDREIRAICG